MSINLWTVKNNSWIVALGYVTYRLENYKKDKSKNPLKMKNKPLIQFPNPQRNGENPEFLQEEANE